MTHGDTRVQWVVSNHEKLVEIRIGQMYKYLQKSIPKWIIITVGFDLLAGFLFFGLAGAFRFFAGLALGFLDGLVLG